MGKSFRYNGIITGLLMVFVVTGSQAAIITADVSGTVGGIPFTDVDSSGVLPSVDVLDGLSSIDTLGRRSNVFYHTYGDQSGSFGSRVDGDGIYDITGIFSYKDTITNTSGADQTYRFDFKVTNGELSLYGMPTSGENLHAEYDLDIRVNGASVWSSTAALNDVGDGSGAAFTSSGTSIGGGLSTSGNTYSWSAYLDSIDLGVLADSESLEFEYILVSHAKGDCASGTLGSVFPTPVPVNVDNAELMVDGEKEVGEGSGATCGSIARIGDPFDFGSTSPHVHTNVNTSNFVTASVPTPGSLALLSLGLVGVAANRRKKIGLKSKAI